ncbi:MAG: LuxR C-terminal-related transcriptional regulator [Solirubrobacteraceae bacterium]
MDRGRDRVLDWIEHCADIGWWTLQLPTMAWTWSEGMYRLHGAEPGPHDLRPGAEAILERVVQTDRERVSSALSVLDEAENGRREDIGLEYWVPSGRAVPRRVRLCGGIEAVPGTEGVSWVGCAQDVTDAYLAARALSALEAAEDALAHWRSFAPSLEHLVRSLALALDSPRAVAWTRGASGRLEERVKWSAAGATPGPSQSLPESAVAAQHKPLARMAWAGGGAVATNVGFGVPAISHGNTVAALTFESRGPAFLDEGLAGALRWLGSALGRRLTGDRPEVGETRLSDREREVLQLAADGYDGPAIAQHLLVSPATVKTHFIRVYEKLGVNDRSAAVARALRQGLIA